MSLLFDSAKIPAEIQGQLPKGYSLRPLHKDDDQRGALECLAVLTTVGEVSREQFVEHFEQLKSHRDTYFTIVITNESERVVAIGTIFVERKIIHATGKVGHIEDIAVCRSQQGRKLGLRIIECLTKIGEDAGCYKVILDCDEKNVGFYNKCGYSRHGVEMVRRFDAKL